MSGDPSRYFDIFECWNLPNKHLAKISNIFEKQFYSGRRHLHRLHLNRVIFIHFFSSHGVFSFGFTHNRRNRRTYFDKLRSWSSEYKLCQKMRISQWFVFPMNANFCWKPPRHGSRVRRECNKTTVFNFFLFVFYLYLTVPRECLECYTHIKTPNVDLVEVMLES